MRVLLFGTGDYYNRYSTMIYRNEKVIALLDNDPAKWGRKKDSVLIHNPEDALKMDFDRIILLSGQDMDMHKQLIALGVPESKLCYLEQYYMESKFQDSPFPNSGKPWEGKKRILILTAELGYHGGALAAVYMAKALLNSGNSVVIVAPEGAADFVEEQRKEGLNLAFYPWLPLVKPDFLQWAGQFDLVIVNVFPMMPCACEISRHRPVLWWLHEAGDMYSDIYKRTLYKYQAYASRAAFSGMTICSVSSQAKRNFKKHFPEAEVDLLPCGIPDRDQRIPWKPSAPLVFAVIGSATQCKGWDIFVKAVRKMGKKEQKTAEFWMIGTIGKNRFGEAIREAAVREPSIRLLGELTRRQMEEAYGRINVVVCCSREETFSLVVLEGLMYRKICVVSDGAGISEFLKNGESALICKAGDSDDLASCMTWCMAHPEKLQRLSENGRSVYEEHFSMDCFGKKLEDMVNRAVGS